MNRHIEAFLKESGEVPAVGVSTELSSLKLNSGSLDGGALVSMLFLDQEDLPRYVMRLPRDSHLDTRLLANYAALGKLEGSPALQGTVPAPVVCGRVDGVLFTLETCLHGTPLAREMTLADEDEEANFTELLERACDWLWLLHSSTWTGQTCRLMPVGPVHYAFLEDDALIAELREYLAPAFELPLAQAYCHGDFHPNNMLLSPGKDRIGVVDWEYSQPYYPLFDLFKFVCCAYVFPFDRAVDSEVRFERLWDTGHPIGRVIAEAVARYTGSGQPGNWDVRRSFFVNLVRTSGALLQVNGVDSETRRRLLQKLCRAELSSPCLVSAR